MAIQNSLVEPKIQNPKSSYLRLFIAKHLTPGNSAWRFLKRHLSLKQPPGKLAVPSTPGAESRTSEVSRTDSNSQDSERTKRYPSYKNQTSKRTSSRFCPRGTAAANATKPKTQSSVAVGSGSKSASRATPVTSAITTPSTPSSDTNLEPAHDWIETQATPNGYVKHPLEQLLEWLDTAMLYLEELVVKIWRWVRRRL
jgi:hypothetical protein